VLRAIAERAKEHGLIAHRFYGADGQIMVIDEWPDPESFQRFFDSQRSEIEPMMQQVATGEPEITFRHKLETTTASAGTERSQGSGQRHPSGLDLR
jgi:hypothetical protein